VSLPAAASLSAERLPRAFFAQDVLQVARNLLGMRLVRLEDGHRLSGIIVEAEAYRGEEDQGCHARAGLTARTRVMYGPPGHAYVYFTYGMHWMLNVVAQEQGFPAAALIRAVLPQEGLEVIARRRAGRPPAQWCDGPAKLCQAFNIHGGHNGLDLCAPTAQVFIAAGDPVPDGRVTIGPRVGLNNTPEPWKSRPWRFRAADG
jgi:DNA-3-methyladenine glycosylase